MKETPKLHTTGVPPLPDKQPEKPNKKIYFRWNCSCLLDFLGWRMMDSIASLKSHIYFSHFSKNTWNLKQPFLIGCFRIPNLYMTNGWKSPNIHLNLVVWSSNNRCIDLMWFSWHFCPTKRQRFCTGCHYCVLRWAIWSSSCGRQIRMRNAFQNTMVPWPKRGKKGGVGGDKITRWWFQIFFMFTPIPGEMIQLDDHIFQMGWNHQLDEGSDGW